MTTALDEFARLEAPGRYYDGRSPRMEPVIVGFGARTLIIYGRANADGDTAMAHWPLASLKALNGRGAGEMTLVPSHDAEERLVLDDPVMMRAIQRVCRDLYRRPVSGRKLGIAGLWGAGAIGSVLLLIFYIIPALAVQLAPMIPLERERALGDAVAGYVARLMGAAGDGDDDGLCSSEDGDVALAEMTERLEAAADLPYEIRVDVLDHELVNAIAMPGGRIFLFRGLIEKAESPEEVAGVLAHEMGHIVHRDPTTGVLRAAGTAGIFSVVLGDIFGAGILAAAGEAMLNASYQREVEGRADVTALEMLAEAGLPSRPFAKFFIRLRDEYGDSSAVMAYFSSHPSLSGRAERAEGANTVGETFNPVLSDRDWVALQSICDARD
ncbi:MAG: M48 family metallopeptidase [Pseudomonadota bacterium]